MTLDLQRARRAAATVVDPEIPVLTVADLGVLHDVTEEEGRVVVTITPTYSGCPAMGQIVSDIEESLAGEGYTAVEVRVAHHPVWSTDRISEAGRAKLAGFGIAPPGSEVVCPRCRAESPRLVSRFGSTACKALMTCSSCGEPFDWFKDF